MAEGAAPPRVAVVGCGRWGKNHVRNYAELGALEAVVDRKPATAAEQAAAYGVRALSFEETLADDGIDALVFALPPSQNLPLGLLALAAGKHLFVEKPLALSVADGEMLCEAAERHGRRLMVGHILQYHPAFLELARLVRSGRLGRLLSLVSTRLDFGRIRREEDALWALAPHDISMILGLVGEEPGTVSARGGRHTHPTIADTATVELGFAAGTRAEIRVSWLHPFKEQRLVVIGSGGMAVFDDREPWDRKLVLYPHRIVGRDGLTSAEKADPAPIPLSAEEPLRLECRQFLAAIAGGERPSSDGYEGLRVLRVLERASESLASLPILPT